MNAAAKTLIAIAAGAAAIAVAATVSTPVLALTLGLAAIGIGGLMASGFIDPLNDVLRPSVAWVSRTAQKGLYFVREKIHGWFSGKQPEATPQPPAPEPVTPAEPSATPATPFLPPGRPRASGWER